MTQENIPLHQQIKDLHLPDDWKEDLTATEMLAYKVGHRDARHAAAELVQSAAVAEYEERIRKLRAALEECADRLAIHMTHTEDLVAHMKAHTALKETV